VLVVVLVCVLVVVPPDPPFPEELECPPQPATTVATMSRSTIRATSEYVSRC
jgi:hypothetical protein